MKVLLMGLPCLAIGACRLVHKRIGRCASLMAILLAALAPRLATAQQEIPPPSGMGRVVLIISGKSGRGPDTPIATRIAALGYHVVLYDSLPLAGTQGRALSAAIEQALKSPHALPGKVGLVGFSLGGGMVLKYGSAWSDRVAIVAAWYPNTGRYLRPGLSEDAIDASALAEHIKVPVVMFAGTDDYYLFCCVIDKARAIASAAREQNAPFELTTYSGIAHGFNLPGPNYSAPATEDAFARTAAALKHYLVN